MKGGADEFRRAERTEIIDVKAKQEQSFQSFWVKPGECDVKQLLVSAEEMPREQTALTSAQADRHQMCADVTLICGCLVMLLKTMMAIVELRRTRRCWIVLFSSVLPNCCCLWNQTGPACNCGTSQGESMLFRFSPACWLSVCIYDGVMMKVKIWVILSCQPSAAISRRRGKAPSSKVEPSSTVHRTETTDMVDEEDERYRMTGNKDNDEIMSWIWSNPDRRHNVGL